MTGQPLYSDMGTLKGFAKPSHDGAPLARARAKRVGRAGRAVRPEVPAGSPRE
jgi:hypothetical protein